MAHQGKIVSHFEMVKAYLPFSVFEYPLDTPPAEGHMEQDFKGGVFAGVGQKVLGLAGEGIARYDKPTFFAGKFLLAGIKTGSARLPHHGPLARIFNVKVLPRRAAPVPQFFHAARGLGPFGQTGQGARPSQGGVRETPGAFAAARPPQGLWVPHSCAPNR